MTHPASPGGAPPVTGGPADPAVLDNLVAADRILADQSVLDGDGHVSPRHPKAPDRNFLARALVPTLIAADLVEFDLEPRPVEQRGRHRSQPLANRNSVRCHPPEAATDLSQVGVSRRRRAQFRKPQRRRPPQAQAIALGGPITYLAPEEWELIAGRGDKNVDRPWQMWKSRITTS